MSDHRASTANIGSLSALFRPSSIAFMGASERPNVPASRGLRHCLRLGFKGGLYPINPKEHNREHLSSPFLKAKIRHTIIACMPRITPLLGQQQRGEGNTSLPNRNRVLPSGWRDDPGAQVVNRIFGFLWAHQRQTPERRFRAQSSQHSKGCSNLVRPPDPACWL